MGLFVKIFFTSVKLCATITWHWRIPLYAALRNLIGGRQMAAKDVRIRKIEIYGNHFYLVYLVKPPIEDVETLEKLLRKKNVARITFETEGRQFRKKLKRIEYHYFMTEDDEIFHII